MAPTARFGGSIAATVQWEGFCATESVYWPHLGLPEHQHDRAYVGITLAGSFTQAVGRRTRQAVPGAVAFQPAGHVHANHFSEKGARCLNIEIAPHSLARLQALGQTMTGQRDAAEGAPVLLGKRLYHEFRLRDELTPLALEGLIVELIAELWRVPGDGVREPRWLRRAAEFIRTNFTEPLSLTAIAQAAGVHPVHLARQFRCAYGCSVGRRVRELRVNRASHLIATTERPLADIAVETGFSDQSQMCRTFRHLVGRTPGDFRVSAGRGAAPCTQCRPS